MDLTLDLSSLFTTKAQATDFAARLSVILEHLYASNFNLDKILSSQFNLNSKDKLIALMRSSSINPNSIPDLKAFLEKIQEKITTLQVISLTLAFEPTEETLQVLSDWFLLNKKQVLLDIKVDPLLIGGALIAFQGKYRDFSIKSKFDQIVNDSLAAESKAQLTSNPAANTKVGGHQSLEHISLGR